MSKPLDAVLMMALGGPEEPGEVRPFIRSVIGRRPVPPQRVEEVVRHYEAIGGRSPLTEWTRKQAGALERQLEEDGLGVPVFVGMRCWSPWLRDTVRAMADQGVKRAATIIMAAQRDRYSWAQYDQSLSDAAKAVDPPTQSWHAVRDWHDHPLFIEALADRIRETVQTVEGVDSATTPLVFSAHSLPARLPDIDDHVARIRSTCEAVARKLPWRTWSIAYQSRSGRPDDAWLEPDVCTAIRELADRGYGSMLIASPGFVCDHVEVLYDLDVEAAGVAAEGGMTYARARTVGCHPSFIRMLSQLVCEVNEGQGAV